jgi:hypothetical protein
MPKTVFFTILFFTVLIFGLLSVASDGESDTAAPAGDAGAPGEAHDSVRRGRVRREDHQTPVHAYVLRHRPGAPPVPRQCANPWGGRRALAARAASEAATAAPPAGALPATITFGPASGCGAGFIDLETANIIRVGSRTCYFAVVTEQAPVAPAKGARKGRHGASYQTIVTFDSISVPAGYLRTSARAVVMRHAMTPCGHAMRPCMRRAERARARDGRT